MAERVMLPADSEASEKGEPEMPAYVNRFKSATYIEETILDDDDGVVGTIRLKPSSILWKPSGARKFYAVPLKRFGDWIASDEAKATKTTK
jgi:hypothetical protein